MKRTTIFLDEAVERDLQALARQDARPLASLVREALATYVATRQPDSAPTPRFVAVGSSGRSDVAERHEELLWRDAAVAAPAAKRARPARKRGASR